MTAFIIALIVLGGAGSFGVWQYVAHNEERKQKTEGKRIVAEKKREAAEAEEKDRRGKEEVERKNTETQRLARIAANPRLHAVQRIKAFSRRKSVGEHIAAMQAATAEEEKLGDQVAVAKQDIETFNSENPPINLGRFLWMFVRSILFVLCAGILFNLDKNLVEVVSVNLDGTMAAGSTLTTNCLTIGFMVMFVVLSLLLHGKISQLTGTAKRAGTIACLTAFALALGFLVSMAPARGEYMHQADLLEANNNRQVIAAAEKYGEGSLPWEAAVEEQAIKQNEINKKIKTSAALFGVGTAASGIGELVCANAIIEAIVHLRINARRKKKCVQLEELNERIAEVHDEKHRISTNAELESREFGEELMGELQKAGVSDYADIVEGAFAKTKPQSAPEVRELPMEKETTVPGGDGGGILNDELPEGIDDAPNDIMFDPIGDGGDTPTTNPPFGGNDPGYSAGADPGDLT